MKKLNSTPLADGFTMPFEGDSHEGTIILLPYRDDTWRDKAKPALDCFYELVNIISKYETVYLGVDENVLNIDYFKNMNNVRILNVSYNDSWARDNTLIYVKKDNEIRAVDFRFNAWGGSVDGLYQDYLKDDNLGKELINYFDDTYYELDSFILEGGSIHTDGLGTLITTKACLLSKGRNYNLSLNEIEQYLKKYLGIKKIIWLDNGIVEDETNEHVDNMACFLKPGVILLATCKDKTDLQYYNSMKAYNTLINETDANGNKLKVVLVNVPTNLKMSEEEAKTLAIHDDAKKRLAGARLAASYVNFYQSNKFVIVPQFGCDEDDEAYELLKDFYKEKDVYKLNSREILLGGGNIHCVTMQIPTKGCK